MHLDETLLNDYMDGTVDAAARGEVDRHLAECAECRTLVDDLRSIHATAATLDPRDPPARAWMRLERAIQLEQDHEDARLKGSRTGNASRYVYASWLAAAAAILIAIGVGIRYRPAAPPAPAVATDGSSADASAQNVEAELRAAEQHYDNAIKGLEQITNAEKGTLDAQTAATLQKNLSVIDQAISESRAAVRAQPASQPAQDSLLESFKAKLSLLQDTVALINEMRKGNDAGAASIGPGLTKKG